MLLEHGETLLEQGHVRGVEGVLSEAGVAFAELRAEPWLGRVAKAREEIHSGPSKYFDRR